AGIGEYRLEVLAGGNPGASGTVELGHPATGVVDATGDFGRRLERGPATGNEFLGAERGQRVERGRPFLQLGIARVHAGVVLDQVAREADLLRRDPGDGVAPGVARANVHDPHLEPAEEQREIAL